MQLREQFHKELSWLPDDTVSFDVTTAAQWYIRDDEKEYYENSELPCLAPPYQEMWMEFVMPSVIRGSDFKQVALPDSMRGSYAVHITTVEVSPEASSLIKGNHNKTLRAIAAAKLGRPASEFRDLNSAEPEHDVPVKWISTMTLLFANKRGLKPVALRVMMLDEKGKYIVDVSVSMMVNMVTLMYGIPETQAQDLIKRIPPQDALEVAIAMSDTIGTFLFCLSLLHCHNVNVIDKPPAPAPILKQRAKKGIPFIQYKTIDVVPLRTVNKQKGVPREPEPKAMHFVRGHFKEFNDKGLFGKYKGTYWWNNQVRGDTSKGIIDKDYRVHK